MKDLYTAVEYEVLKAYPKNNPEELTVAVLSAVNQVLADTVFKDRDTLAEVFAVLIARGETLGYADDGYRAELAKIVGGR